MKIGILLPGSTTYPLISYNFMAGLTGCLTQLAPDMVPQLHTAVIGFGTDKALMLQEAQVLLLEKNTDILIAFADHPAVECLFPLMASVKKLLIVVNSGAKYLPVQAQPYVVYHTLAHALHCRLTGSFAAGLGNSAAMATSFYDGGYSLCHAISKAYTDKGGAIEFNFVSKFKAQEFDINPLTGFLDQNDGTRSILGIYSDLSPVFYQQLMNGFPQQKLNVFSNPAMLDELHLPQNVLDESISVNAYVPWTISLGNEQHLTYVATFEKETGREPDAFGALGWDTGVLLHYIISDTDNPLFRMPGLMAHLQQLHAEGAKGTLIFDKNTHLVLSPAYRVKLEAGNTLVITDTLPLNEVVQEWTAICEDLPKGHVSEWINTYMCS